MIRPMKEEDLACVADLEKICFTECWSYKLLEAGINSPYDLYFVALCRDQIIGYCCLLLLAGEGEIQRIAVLPQKRRMGAGRKMMETMVSYAMERHVYAISLEVRESNLAARRLYESFGFAPEAVRKNYYHNPVEDAVIMWRRRN